MSVSSALSSSTLSSPDSVGHEQEPVSRGSGRDGQTWVRRESPGTPEARVIIDVTEHSRQPLTDIRHGLSHQHAGKFDLRGQSGYREI